MFKSILLAIALLANLSLFADTSQGEVLERKVWDDIKNQKWDSLDNSIAPYFQLALFEGARNKEQFMIRAKTLDLSDYIMNDFNVTEGPDLMVVSYSVSVSETIEGKRLSSKAVRLSVWQKNKGDWKWVAHSVLIPVPPPSSSKQ
jgi:hypothetical protein